MALSAERASAQYLYRWIHQRESSAPWRDIDADINLKRLRSETVNRVLRRQTGNDAAYSAFIDWLDEWHSTPHPSEREKHRRIAVGLLAFPVETFFWDRVFEIWCLTQVAAAIQRAGAIPTVGPRCLSLRREQAIYEFDHDGSKIEVWFQRSLPSVDATWKYSHSEQWLRGMPDITITCEGERSFIIDAKHRLATTATRSEESYKMLGYLENFRSHYENDGFFGALIFLAERQMETTLKRSDGVASLALCAAHPRDAESCSLVDRLSKVIGSWLSTTNVIAVS